MASYAYRHVFDRDTTDKYAFEAGTKLDASDKLWDTASVAARELQRSRAEMMLHTLHYDVAFYEPGNKWHPGSQKKGFLFAAMTLRGEEELKSAPYGEYRDGHLIITCDDEATEVMDRMDSLEVYMAY